MKVWVIVDNPGFEPSPVVGVFSSEEKAEAHKAAQKNSQGIFFEINEWEIDGETL